MAERAKKYDKEPKKFLTPEELEKEKVRIQKMKRTIYEQTEATHDGRPSLELEDPLYEALYEIHKGLPGTSEYDPALNLDRSKYIESRGLMQRK